MALTQKDRAAAIATPLPEDKLVLRSLSGTEQLGQLFQFELELLSDDTNLNFDDLIGQNVTVRVDLQDGKTRFFNGYISRFVQTTYAGDYACYSATMVPWLWFLTRTADCRIFQDKKVPEILEDVFKGHGFDAYELRLSGNYQKWGYCVQYRETDFNFVSRLMEQEGIYYYFKHEDGKHTLVLADSPGAHDDFPGYEEIAYRPADDVGTSLEHVRDWVINKELQSGAYAHTDFNFEKPKTQLLAKSNIPRQHAAADFEVFDYPGEYEEAPEGDAYAKMRIEEIHSRHEVLQGHADARGICAGYTFTLTEFPRQDQNRKYLVLSASHAVEVSGYVSGDQGQEKFYQCSFSVVDAVQPFRAPRTTPKPLIQGPQTALVVGPKGEEIHTDKYGRVKVMFHWDRYAKADENSSCWVRVSQSLAGKKWGAFYLPRIGQEVIVEFLEGDPDRPIITGRVYNAEAMPPYDLPGKATISTLKSNSSKGGAGFNEIRFEDKKGDEQIYIHAEKNMDVRVKNDAFETVGNNKHVVVKKDQFEHVENNRSETVDADHKEKIGKDRHLKVVGKEAKAVDGSLSLSVKGDVIEVFKANQSTQVTKDYYLTADNIVIEGKTHVTVKVGGSSIAIEGGGIGIKTEGDITIEAKGNIDVTSTGETTIYGKSKFWGASDGDVKLTGMNTKLEADAEIKLDATGNVTVKGALVKIN